MNLANVAVGFVIGMAGVLAGRFTKSLGVREYVSVRRVRLRQQQHMPDTESNARIDELDRLEGDQL